MEDRERRLLVEADPSGGDLGLWLGLPAAAGLAGLAAAARHGHEAGLPWRHARELAGGTHLVTAPAGAEQAAACVAALAAAGLPQELAAGDEPVLADCGRLYPGSPALAVAAAAAVTLLVVRPRVSELAHLEPRIRGLEQAGLRLALILAADGRRAARRAVLPGRGDRRRPRRPRAGNPAGRPAGGGAAVPPRRRPRAGAAAAPAARGRRRSPGRWRRPWDSRPPRPPSRPGRRTVTRRR